MLEIAPKSIPTQIATAPRESPNELPIQRLGIRDGLRREPHPKAHHRPTVFAGERADVDRIIRALDSLLPPKASELRDHEAILGILNTCDANTELVALLIWAKAIYPFGVRTRGFELDNRRIYLLGSGASDFFEYLQTHPNVMPNQEGADALVAQAIMLRFAARAIALQWTIGTGLRASWGGGFEVASPIKMVLGRLEISCLEHG